MAWAPKFARSNDELVRLFNENMRGIESELARRPQASITETKIRTLPIASPIVGLQLGETSTTAYRGDRGKIAYDHSQTTGNPHGATAADVGAAADLHAAQHGVSGFDPIIIKTSQIRDVSAFMRTVLDDASAAAARTTLDAAQSTHAHGAVTTDGKIGTTAGLPVTTGAGGALQAAAWSTTAPVMNGTASVGTSVVPSRSDHVHPSDTTKANATTIINQSNGWHELGYCDLPGATYGSVYGRYSIVGCGIDCSFDFVVERSPSNNSVSYGFTYKSAFLANPPKLGVETLADGITVRVRWFVFCGSNHAAKISYTVGSTLGDLSTLIAQTYIGSSLPSISFLNASEYNGVCNTIGTRAGYIDKIGGTDTTPLAGNVQTQINGLVTKSASAILNGGSVDYWGKVFEITGMDSVYNRGEFTIAWKLYNGSYYQGELQINVSGSDASPQISLIQLGDTSTVMFTAVRNGTTWEIWAKQVSRSYNAMQLQIVYSSLSTITGFSTTPTAASVSGTSANVYRYVSQSQYDLIGTISDKVSKTGDETIAGSKTFSAIPTVPNQSAESVGGGAANAQFVADKVYPGNEGAFITASCSITLVHGKMRVVNADNLTITLTKTPALGTVSWLYYTPVRCSTGSLTLSFADPIGVPRTYQKTAFAGSSRLPHWIKCTRCLYGWIVEWETEA